MLFQLSKRRKSNFTNALKKNKKVNLPNAWFKIPKYLQSSLAFIWLFRSRLSSNAQTKSWRRLIDNLRVTPKSTRYAVGQEKSHHPGDFSSKLLCSHGIESLGGMETDLLSAQRCYFSYQKGEKAILLMH